MTLNEDGSAHSAPLWIDVDDDGLVLVNSAVGRKKDRNIRRDPRVVVSVALAGRSVHLDGDQRHRRVDVTGDEAEAHIDLLSQKYYDGKRWDRARIRARA